MSMKSALGAALAVAAPVASQSAHAAYLVTECYGGDYKFVISLEQGTKACPGGRQRLAAKLTLLSSRAASKPRSSMVFTA
jgi:hypothetical protein